MVPIPRLPIPTVAAIALAVVVASVGCSSSSTSGASFSRCNSYNFMKAKTGEVDLLKDVEKLIQRPGVALVADYHLAPDVAYLTVYCSAGADLAAREAALAMGYSSIDAIPKSCKAGSRSFGRNWNRPSVSPGSATSQ